MHNIVLERLYLINLGRKQKNPSTLHHTVKVKFAEFEVIYCMGWLMWFGAKRHFLPGSIDAQYCSGAFIFNKSWQKTKKSFNSSPYRQGQICRIWSNILYGMTDVVWRKKTFSARFFFFLFNKSWQKTKKSFFFCRIGKGCVGYRYRWAIVEL